MSTSTSLVGYCVMASVCLHWSEEAPWLSHLLGVLSIIHTCMYVELNSKRFEFFLLNKYSLSCHTKLQNTNCLRLFFSPIALLCTAWATKMRVILLTSHLTVHRAGNWHVLHIFIACPEHNQLWQTKQIWTEYSIIMCINWNTTWIYTPVISKHKKSKYSKDPYSIIHHTYRISLHFAVSST